MLRRKSLIFFTFVFAIVALFTVSDVFATCTDPECFSAGGCEISVRRGAMGEWPLVVTYSNQSVSPYSDYAQACINTLEPDFPCTVFAYNINDCNYSHINQALSNPSAPGRCPENPFDILYLDPTEAGWRDEGVGGNSNWYANDSSIRVLVWPSNLPTNQKGFYIITTNNISSTDAPVYLERGNKKYYGSLLAPECQGAVPVLQFTQKGYTVVDESQDPPKTYNYLVTFDQFGQVHKVELCDDAGCSEIALRPIEEVFSCYPTSLYPSGCPDDGEEVLLPPLGGGADVSHCCRRITDVIPGEPTTYKAGDNFSCPMFINGRWNDPCAGVF